MPLWPKRKFKERNKEIKDTLRTATDQFRRQQQNTLYGEARHRQLARIVTFTSVKDAEKATKKLKKEFKKAKTKDYKLAILRATVQAANRARASTHKHDLRPETRERLQKISKIYEKCADELQKEYDKL